MWSTGNIHGGDCAIAGLRNTIQGPVGPKANSVPDGVFAFMEILFSLQAASSILAACADVVAGIGRISGVGGRVGILVQDN